MTGLWLTAALVLSLAGCAAAPDGSLPLPAAASAARSGEAAAPLVSKIEHFYATAPDAERLFHFFRDSLGLAEAWPYRSWGDFSSGGISLGNVAFELVYHTPGAAGVLPTAFAGIAFEPVAGTAGLLTELARRGIAHESPDSTFTVTARGDRLGWINTGLPDWSAYGLFFCDYVPRDHVAAGRRAAADRLAAARGGALGVLAMREIRLGAADLEAAHTAWRQLIDSPVQESGDAFAFGEGPGVRLVPAPEARILGIVLQVQSLERARAYLAERGWLGEPSAESVAIAPAVLGGLHIELVE